MEGLSPRRFRIEVVLEALWLGLENVMYTSAEASLRKLRPSG